MSTIDHTHSRADSFRRSFQGRRLNDYRGLPIFAAKELHPAAHRLLEESVPTGVRILDVGAGSGALSLRLNDAGYQMTATDLLRETFRPADIPFVQADLNEAFAVRLPGPFDAIVALEIIEHLENPRHLLRQLRGLLPKGGQLVLSTPNIANPVSQSLFLRRGQHQWFTDSDYREQGHITPLSPWTLSQALHESGFALRHEEGVGSPFARARRLGLPVHLLSYVLAIMSGLPRSQRGEVWLVRAEAV
ncbi:class I SAM-dependent methyltransferase [Lysobacter sp. TAF61]|uniref:class I SAM-dependent methyltransferase n=1 Tax=Lysobacter sp. TAF61 TaxID=3233072 RepID=UPI003F9CE0F1